VSGALEARYRAALRWYPRSWRAENADAIVGTMLDQAEAQGRSTPLPGELCNLASSGASRRLERFAPRAVRDRLALIALLMGTALSLLSTVLAEWAPFVTRETILFDDGSFFIPAAAGFGPFLSAGVLIYFAWILAFCAVLLKRQGVAAIVVGLTIPFSVVLYLFRPEPWAANQGSPVTSLILDGLALLVILGNARRPLAPARTAIALLFAIAVVVTGTEFAGTIQYYSRIFVYFEPRVIVAVLALLAIVAGVRQSHAWTAALVLSALPWAVISLMYVVPLVVGGAIGASLCVLVIAFGIWRASRVASPNVPSSRSS